LQADKDKDGKLSFVEFTEVCHFDCRSWPRTVVALNFGFDLLSEAFASGRARFSFDVERSCFARDAVETGTCHQIAVDRLIDVWC
jgi:hypothetical protein